MMRKACLLPLVLLVVFMSIAARAENWPQWRGPTQDGVAAGESYPVTWGEDENIAWKKKLPGWGTSTPAVWEQSIFLTSADDEGRNTLICLNRAGEEQWQVECGASVDSRNRKASGANPSPATDGRHVFAYYKSGDLACVDFEGKIAWQTNLQEKHGPNRLWWDLGTSPVLTEDHVVVAVMHQGPSYLVAFDKETGEQAWFTKRDLDAPGEAEDSYTTPLVIRRDGGEMIVVLGADHLTAYDDASGEELWRAGGLNPGRRQNFRSISSPVAAGDFIVAPYSRGETLTAVRLGGSGDVTKSHVAWTLDDAAADVPCPAARDGRVYVCGDRGKVTCIDVAGGKELWTESLPTGRDPYSSSPIVAGDRLYCTREDGTTFVLRLGEKPELIATNVLRERTYATPVFCDGRAYIRTSDYLFCIGDK